MGHQTIDAAAFMRARAEMKLTAASRHPPRSVYRTTAEDDAARYRIAADAIEALAAATERAEKAERERAAAEARAERLETACTEVDRLLEGVEGFGPSDDESLDAVHAALTAALAQ